MSMQASTIRILEAANFSPPQALALAEAIETEIRGSELVTVPAMDSRFAKLDARLEARFGKIDERFAKVDERFAKVDERFAKVDAQFADVKRLIAEAENRLFSKGATLGLTLAGIVVTAVYFIVLNVKR